MKLVPFLIHWHRRSGLIILPVILMLAITGILINHSQSLGWAKTPVYSSWVAWLYGIHDTDIDQGFATGKHWVSQVGDSLYLDQSPIGHCEQPLLGALRWQETIALLCNNRIALYLPDGQLVEELTNLPVQASAIGTMATATHHSPNNTSNSTSNNTSNNTPENGSLLLQANPPYYLDNNSWSWQTARSDLTADWATPESLPQELTAQLNSDKPVPGITRERLLLDLHSGRLFGRIGVWVVDAVSIVLIFLALSGTFTWLKRIWLKQTGLKRTGQQHNPHKRPHPPASPSHQQQRQPTRR